MIDPSTAAFEYVEKVFLTVDLQVGNTNLTDEQMDRVFSTIHEQIALAWIAGYCAGRDDDQEAA